MTKLHKARILMVDDEEDFVILTSEFLETRGYKVDVAHTGREALGKIKAKPDLIILDRTLTDMEGLEICRIIREDESLEKTPVMILSALDMPMHKSEGLYIGADDYVAKPFDCDELLARIEALLRRQGFVRQDFRNKEEAINELNKLLKENLIVPFFQPIFDLSSKKLLGVEVLSRPPQNSIFNNPEILFKAALNFGKYFDLEMAGWKKAVQIWNAAGIEGKVLLNCSPFFIEDERYDQRVFIETMGVAPDKVILEITERLAIMDYSKFIEKLLRLKAKGFEIAVDDVGSGYAGLETIAELKPNLAKIDMSLIRNIHQDELKQNIVEAIIAFCKKSHIRIIGEGIEKREELDRIFSLGVDAGQGYFFAKPSADPSDYKTVCF